MTGFEKYILYICGVDKKAIVFDTKIKHIDEFNKIKEIQPDSQLYSAGLIIFDLNRKEVFCFGKSESLNIESNREDNKFIKEYLHSINFFQELNNDKNK